jgi:hypothetical protein
MIEVEEALFRNPLIEGEDALAQQLFDSSLHSHPSDKTFFF